MTATRTGLALHAVCLLGVLAIGTGFGIGFALPISQGITAKVQSARSMIDGAGFHFLSVSPSFDWRR